MLSSKRQVCYYGTDTTHSGGRVSSKDFFSTRFGNRNNTNTRTVLVNTRKVLVCLYCFDFQNGCGKVFWRNAPTRMCCIRIIIYDYAMFGIPINSRYSEHRISAHHPLWFAIADFPLRVDWCCSRLQGHSESSCEREAWGPGFYWRGKKDV